MLVLCPIPPRDEPIKVPLVSLDIWIQIHDLSTGFMSEAVEKQLGNFFCQFIVYNVKNNTGI